MILPERPRTTFEREFDTVQRSGVAEVITAVDEPAPGVDVLERTEQLREGNARFVDHHSPPGVATDGHRAKVRGLVRGAGGHGGWQLRRPASQRVTGHRDLAEPAPAEPIR